MGRLARIVSNGLLYSAFLVSSFLEGVLIKQKVLFVLAIRSDRHTRRAVVVESHPPSRWPTIPAYHHFAAK